MTKLREWVDEKYGSQKVLDGLERVISLLPSSNKKTLELQSAQDATLERLKRLISEDLNIEYLTTGSAIVEYAIKRVLFESEFVLNSSLVLSDFDTDLKVEVRPDGEDKTLGALISELKRVCKNERLFGLLGNFNGNRRRATHRIYDKNQDINLVNEELREYVKGHPIFTIILELRDVHTSLVLNLVNKLKELGCTPLGSTTGVIDMRKE